MSLLISQRRGPTASLAVAPKTPRYMSDIDPVGQKEHARRKREKERVYQSHAKAAAAVASIRIGGSDKADLSERAKYALESNGRNPRDNFAADVTDDKDYLANPSGHPDHELMAERGRRRRSEKTMHRQDEEKAVAEAARRQASRNKAKKRRWLRERDAAARKEKQKIDEEKTREVMYGKRSSGGSRNNKRDKEEEEERSGSGENNNNNNDDFHEEEDDGDLSSDTDSDEERRHTVGKKDINAFVKRQEEAEKRKAAAIKRIENEQKIKNAQKWQTVTPGSSSGETGALVLPPAPPQDDGNSTQYPVGNGSRAALALSRARAALGEASPRQQVKPSVVSLDF